MRSPNVSDADVARGKATLKAEILYAADDSATLLENLGQQALFKGRVYKPSDLVAEVDKISTSDVKSVSTFVICAYPMKCPQFVSLLRNMYMYKIYAYL